MNKILLALMLSTVALNINAQVRPVDDGLAIGGYDVVAYFSNNAVEGNANITAKYNEATYRFSSEENRELFLERPTEYLPQFDGYCAWAVGAKESKYPSNPETFDIVDGKLYLFFNGKSNLKKFNAKEPWIAATTTLKDAAHEKWPRIK